VSAAAATERKSEQEGKEVSTDEKEEKVKRKSFFSRKKVKALLKWGH
jgi:hypothetical protein